MLLIMCVLLITCIVLIIVCKKYIKIIAAIGGIIVIIFSITLLTPIIDENNRINSLEADLINQKIERNCGYVQSLKTYARSRETVKINGEQYYFLLDAPQKYGDIVEGWKYEIWYLENSNYILKYQVADDMNLENQQKIDEKDYYKFANTFYEIKDIYEVDTLAYEYVRNYYHSIDEKLETSFINSGWEIFSYYREDVNAYVSYFKNTVSTEYKYLVINKETGCPMYFIENNY